MTIDEAIEHNKEIKTMLIKGNHHPEKSEAIQIGIEGLKAIKHARLRDYRLPYKLTLPGETE